MKQSEEKEVLEHPILWAASHNHTEIVRRFLKLDKNLVREKDQWGSSLLHKISDLDLFKEIVALEPSLLLAKNSQGCYPIHFAAGERNLEMFEYLLEMIPKDIMAELRGEASPLPILGAIENGHIEIVRRFLNYDKSLVQKKSPWKENLLHLIKDQDLFKEIVTLEPSLLLEQDAFGHYPIDKCLVFAKELLRWVAEQDISQLYLKDADENLLIHRSINCWGASSSFAKWIISQDDMFLRAKNKSGHTPLHIAFQYHHFDLARFLIERDFELVFERDEEGMWPIAYADFMEDATDFFLWLFEKVPDFIVEKTYQKCYPIHLAAWHGNLKLVEYLVERTPQELLKS